MISKLQVIRKSSVLLVCMFFPLAAKITVITAENERTLRKTPKKTAPLAPQKNEKKEPALQEKTDLASSKKSSKKKKKKNEEKKVKQKRKTVREMSYEELKESKNKYLAQGDTSTAMKFLEKMIPLCNDLEELRVIMLELADLFFDNGNLEKAGKMYGEFTKLYPGNSKVEYASYKAILCNFYATLESDRDQTKTRETVELAQAFLQRSDVFTTHSNDVSTILENCRKKIIDSEMNIFNFYFKRGNYTSAQKRIDGIRKEFGVLIPVLEPQLLTLECAIAEKQNKPELIAQKKTELAQKFPTFNAELLAQNDKPRIAFVNKF